MPTDYKLRASRLSLCRICPDRRDQRCTLNDRHCVTNADQGDCPLGHFRLPARPRSDLCRDKIRVGLAAHGLYEGGVEEWFRCLVAGNPDPSIEYTAIGVFDHTRQPTHRGWNLPIVPHDQLHQHCDLILGWSTDLSHLRDWPGKIVYIAHGSSHWTATWVNRFSRFSDALVAVSEAARNIIDVPPEAVHLIRNGVNLERLITREQRDVLRPTLGFLGRWSDEKRAPLVAEAARLIGCRAAFLIPEEKQPEARQFLDRTGIDYFFVTTADLPLFLQRISCLVVPSAHEGGPLVVAEAWASGAPVACTPVGMVPELEAEFGRLTVPLSNPPTPEELATILERIDPSVTEKAYTVARTYLTQEQMSGEYALLFRRLIPREFTP